MEHNLSIIGQNFGALLQSIIGNFKSIIGTSLFLNYTSQGSRKVKFIGGTTQN